MGSLNRKIHIDHEGGASLTHRARLRFERSQDGSVEGLPLFHGYVDVHATFDPETGAQTVVDTPITDADRRAVRLMAKVATEYGMDGGAILDAIIKTAWGEDVRSHAFALLIGDGTGDAAFAAIVEQLVALDQLLGGE